MVVFTGVNNHGSDLRQMSARRPQHCLGRHLSDPDVSYPTSSLSQRRDQKLLLYFKGRGRAYNFSNSCTEQADDRNIGRLRWEAIQRPDYSSLSRPCRFWPLRRSGSRRISPSCRSWCVEGDTRVPVPMSAFEGKADISRTIPDVCF